MEQPFMCKCLTAEYEEEKIVLGGPIHINFDIEKGKNFHMDIMQCKNRTIKISTDSDTSIYELNSILMKLEKLLMLFDGQFIQLNKMKFSESDILSSNCLDSCATNLMLQRPNYFSSADLYKNTIHMLINFKDVLTTDLFKKWDTLLDEMGVP